MSESPHLGLGYLAPSQAQKHVTVNEAFRRLDALVQLGVLDRTLTAPPPSPAEGDRHIVAAGATGDWDGQDGRIAAWLDGTWVFVEPKPGWLAYVAAEGQLLAFVGGAWISALGSLSSLEALTRLGVNATPDPVNRLAVASQAVLFNHDGAGVQVKLNKAAAGATSSLLFQTGFSGRAEFGLAGSDGLSLKVSPDGAVWMSALTVDPATGAVDLPATTRVKVDKFTASGTWTKPAWARRVKAIVMNGGPGGGSGGLRGAGVAVAGGGGGVAGQCIEADFLASQLTATVAVTVGAGGTGGAAVTANDANGANGSSGGESRFGGYVRAFVDAFYAGQGGNASSGAAGTLSGGRFRPPFGGSISGGAGSTGSSTGASHGPGFFGSGAGGGGGVNAANAAGAGGASGYAGFASPVLTTSAGGATIGAAGANGVATVSPGLDMIAGGSGGGGAGGGASTDGGAGGDGAAPGGAGGGGGAARNGRQSGRGGNGGDGAVWVISYG